MALERHATSKPTAGGGGPREAVGERHDMAPSVEPRWNPGTRKVVGATGFEPATPGAQGKLGRPLKVLILERFAASENSWAQIWAHPRGDAL